VSDFAGFHSGRGPLVPVPDAFFSVVLPQIESLAELKVTLHLFWLLSQRRGLPKAVSLAELESDRLLLRSIRPVPGPRPAVDFLREGLERLGHDELDPREVVGGEVGAIEIVRIYRPNIFTLYERNIGVLTPLIVDQLRAAELDYPADWIAEAMRLAVEYNKRNWAYMAGILKRWEAEGKQSGIDRRHPEQNGAQENYTGGRYGHLVES